MEYKKVNLTQYPNPKQTPKITANKLIEIER
jgi:hypothetical protein